MDGVMGRSYIPLKTKLASALCQMLRPNEDGKFERIVSYEDSKKLSEDQILSLFHWHHNILHAHNGLDSHWNIEPVPILEHRRDTAKRDIPAVAKVRRLTPKQEEFRRKVLEKPCGQKRVRKWGKRKIHWSKKKSCKSRAR